MKNKFKYGDIMGSYWKAMNAYRVENFNGYMTEISRRYLRLSECLDNQVRFEKWSRCHFSGLTKEYYTLAYEDTIYPVSSQSQWNVLDEVTTWIVKPREVKKRKKGMPKCSRYPSMGENRKHKNRCKNCKEYGHYQKKFQKKSQTGSNEENPTGTPTP